MICTLDMAKHYQNSTTNNEDFSSGGLTWELGALYLYITLILK
jgi:hypothetical protein